MEVYLMTWKITLEKCIPPILFSLLIKAKNVIIRKSLRQRLFGGNIELFSNQLKNANVYFEYGCGDSTLFASQIPGLEVHSVDTSQVWADAVSKSTKNRVIWVDVGDLLEWGRPSDYSKRANYKTYREALWANDKQPDVVLIDGRFRVACFLTVLLKVQKQTSIIFDDYTFRKNYHIIEELISPHRIEGRQALFNATPLNESDRKRVSDLLEKFEYVMD